MIISARHNTSSVPLRRMPTPNILNPAHLSKKCLRISSVESPLPSPRLSSTIPSHGKKVSRTMHALFSWIVGLVVIIWFALSFLKAERPPDAINYLSQDGKSYEIVGSDVLPNFPGPIVVTDRRGRSRWTISVPPNQEFPLSPSECTNICSQSMDLAQHLAVAKGQRSGTHSHSGHHGYYYKDPNFMDIADAQKHGLLPGSDVVTPGSVVGGNTPLDGDEKAKVCEKSLTFVMQTEDAGMGGTLMGLWMSYGLAMKEGRAFFIDDTNWAYGRYTTYFKLPPMPSCHPPPMPHRIPCPHHARHLLVSAATTPWTFGHSFNDHFEDPRKMGVDRQHMIFSFLRTGYEALFQLAGNDSVYYQKRMSELASLRDKGGLQVGIHVRHGDRHPMEFQYQKSYLPLEKYIEAARDIIVLSRNHSRTSAPQNEPSTMILASDDPDVYSSAEMKDAKKAQFLISLASKSTLDATSAAQGGNMKLVEGNIGWEGGFFREIFWSLGAPPPPLAEGSPPPSKRQPVLTPRSREPTDVDYFHFHPSERALRLRELVGRAYILDLAVLGQTDAVVCGVSTIACRLLAVMMGWEKGIEGGRWKNVDGSFDWKGIVW